MGGPSPPNAKDVAGTQEYYNKRAADYGLSLSEKGANYQNELNQINQVTPTGSLTYQRIGTNKDGSPIMRATTKLTPQQQVLLNRQTRANTAAATQSTNIINQNAGKWARGPDMDETGITKAIMGWGHDFLDPGFERAAASEDAKLANQGIMPGTEAYNNAVTNRNRGKNDAYTQLLLQGQGQAMTAAEAKYMDPLRAISTLSSGAQPSVNFAQTPQAGVSTQGVTSPDFATAANNQYNAKKSNSDALMGGLFKIPQTILGGWASGGF